MSVCGSFCPGGRGLQSREGRGCRAGWELSAGRLWFRRPPLLSPCSRNRSWDHGGGAGRQIWKFLHSERNSENSQQTNWEGGGKRAGDSPKPPRGIASVDCELSQWAQSMGVLLIAAANQAPSGRAGWLRPRTGGINTGAVKGNSRRLFSQTHITDLTQNLWTCLSDSGRIFGPIRITAGWDFVPGRSGDSSLSALWIFLIILDLVDYFTDFNMTLEEVVGSNSTEKK